MKKNRGKERREVRALTFPQQVDSILEWGERIE
jgi:hypothetical protein